MVTLSRLGAGLLAFLFSLGILSAAPLRVAVLSSEPFVYSQDAMWSGLAIDIWQEIATQNGWTYEIKEYPDSKAAGKALKMGEADVVVADVPITVDALQYAEFSQPFFRAGLQIMVSTDRRHTLGRLWEDMESWGHTQIFWWLCAVVVILTVLVTLFERHHNPDFPKKWGDGLAEAFYYVISLALTGKSVYKGFPGVLGRLMLVVWMLVGVFMVAFITSSITASMTVEKLSHISGPQDLVGKTIAAVEGSKALDYLNHHHLDAQIFPTLPEAVNALVKGQVRAIVGSAPILQYYDANHPALPITEVGPVFAPYNYGFALPEGSELRRKVNASLLQMQESGALLDLAKRYFGTLHQP